MADDSNTADGIINNAISRQLVGESVRDINAKWNLNVQASDYEVYEDANSFLVQRKGTQQKRTATVDPATGSVTVGVTSAATTPTPQEQQRQRAAGLTRVERDVEWYQPNCSTLYGKGVYGEAVSGYYSRCEAFGGMGFPGETTANWAFKQYGTCKAGKTVDGARLYELTGCEVKSFQLQGGIQWTHWRDWQPRSDTQLSQCRQTTLNIGWGPIAAGLSFNSCDTQDITKGDHPGDFSSIWKGEVYDSERETASLIAISSALGGPPYVNIGIYYAYSYHLCGSLGEPCG